MKALWMTSVMILAFASSTMGVFADGDDDDDDGGARGGSGGSGKVNSGKAVPHLADNEASADFIAKQIAKDSKWKAKDVMGYSRRLAKTLAQFNAGEQQIFWYGR